MPALFRDDLCRRARRGLAHVPGAGAALAGLILAVCLAAPQGARAERADRLQPLNFAADNAKVDDVRRNTILTGNVEITKGSIALRAERVEVRQQADGTQVAVATGGNGGRAYFRQRREGLDEYIEGQAERVEYDSGSDVVRFTGRAVMRRLNGAAVADEVIGQTIVYDNKTEVFQVVGGGGPASSGGRVRGVIAPRRDVGKPAPASEGVGLSPSGALSQPKLESAR